MKIQQIKKTGKWRRGAGELLGYTMSAIGILSIFILILGFAVVHSAYTNMEEAASRISRDVVVCTSLEKANELANKEAKVLLADASFIKVGSVHGYVDYAPGSTTEWKKGNFIMVTISAHVTSTTPITSGTKTVSDMTMIERNEE